MRDVVMGTGPFAVNEAPGVRVVGLLGFDFLDAATVNIDDAGGFVEAMRPGSLVAPTSATPVEIRLSSGAPVTRATPPYVVFQHFARAHPMRSA